MKANNVKLLPAHSDRIKLKIQASNILHRIQRYVLEEDYEMHPMKVNAGLKLLNKVLPDAIHQSTEINNKAQALQAISQAQLALMAKEMLQGKEAPINKESILEGESTTILEDTTQSNTQQLSDQSSLTPSVELEIPEFVVKEQQVE